MTDEQSKTSEICVEPGKDVFGNQLLKVKKFTEEIVCPSCHRHISANRFAPHLGKTQISALTLLVIYNLSIYNLYTVVGDKIDIF